MFQRKANFLCPLTGKNNNNKERVILLHSPYSGISQIMFNTAPSSVHCGLRINDPRPQTSLFGCC